MKASTFEKQISALKRERNAFARRAKVEEKSRIEQKKQFDELVESRRQIAEARDRALNWYNEAAASNTDLASELERANTVWKRLAQALTEFIKTGIEKRKQRLVNWFMVKRLNKPRVEAVTEAGYIPAKLIKIAHKYWEYDQERLQHDEQIVSERHSDFTLYSRPPGIFRRIKIILGRA